MLTIASYQTVMCKYIDVIIINAKINRINEEINAALYGSSYHLSTYILHYSKFTVDIFRLVSAEHLDTKINKLKQTTTSHVGLHCSQSAAEAQ